MSEADSPTGAAPGATLSLLHLAGLRRGLAKPQKIGVREAVSPQHFDRSGRWRSTMARLAGISCFGKLFEWIESFQTGSAEVPVVAGGDSKPVSHVILLKVSGRMHLLNSDRWERLNNIYGRFLS
jgi:hypothetical protein